MPAGVMLITVITFFYYRSEFLSKKNYRSESKTISQNINKTCLASSWKTYREHEQSQTYFLRRRRQEEHAQPE